MSDVMRWRYGDTNPVVLPVPSATAIEIGDLLYWDTNQVKPATSQTNGANEAANQATFHTKFAGVAMQRSRVGDSSPIRVATTGVFDFAAASATFEVGDYLGACNNGGNTGIESQKVKKVTAADHAIARCAKRVASADTRVLVDIVSTLTLGGPQVAA